MDGFLDAGSAFPQEVHHELQIIGIIIGDQNLRRARCFSRRSSRVLGMNHQGGNQRHGTGGKVIGFRREAINVGTLRRKGLPRIGRFVRHRCMRCGHRRCTFRGFRSESGGDTYGEGAALSQGTLAANRAAEHVGQLLGDAQSQPRPAEAALNGFVGLEVGLKQPLLLRFGDANALVNHIEQQKRGLVRRRPNHQTNWPPRGELERIGNQIGENLSQPSRVGLNFLWDVGMLFQNESQPLHFRAGAHQPQDFLQNIGRAAGHTLHRQLARFHPRQFQNVIQKLQQMPAVVSQGIHRVIAFGDGQVEIGQQIRIPQHRRERGPDFVTHASQKLTLGLGGLLGFEFGLLQLLHQLRRSRLLNFGFLPA